MLLARNFSYADAHRARLGVNYKQIPVNSPRVEVHAYSKDGAMRIRNATDPVYAPNSKGGPRADTARHQPVGWHSDGDLVRSAYMPHAEDDDFVQAGTMVREVLDDAARDRLVSNIVGHLPARRQRSRSASCLPVLAQRGQGARRPGRGWRQRQLGRNLSNEPDGSSRRNIST